MAPFPASGELCVCPGPVAIICTRPGDNALKLTPRSPFISLILRQVLPPLPELRPTIQGGYLFRGFAPNGIGLVLG